MAYLIKTGNKNMMREGAELILFYSAAFTGRMSNPAYIAYGIAAGVLVLVIVWVCFRYFSVRLPLRAFFMFTGIKSVKAHYYTFYVADVAQRKIILEYVRIVDDIDQSATFGEALKLKGKHVD